MNAGTKSKLLASAARPLLLSIPEVRRELGGISRSSLYAIFRAGKLRVRKIGARSFVKSADLDAYVATLPPVSLDLDVSAA